jgi:hypothetical protein
MLIIEQVGEVKKLTLASKGASSLGSNGSGHVAVQVVDVVDTSNEGSNGVLSIQAGLAILQGWDAVLAEVARAARLGAITGGVTVVLGPGGGGGDVSSGHCE